MLVAFIFELGVSNGLYKVEYPTKGKREAGTA